MCIVKCALLSAKHSLALVKGNVHFAVQHWKGNPLWSIGEELQSAVQHWGGGAKCSAAAGRGVAAGRDGRFLGEILLLAPQIRPGYK